MTIRQQDKGPIDAAGDHIHVLVATDFSAEQLDRIRVCDPRIRVAQFDGRGYDELLAWAEQAHFALESVQVLCGGFSFHIEDDQYKDRWPNLRWIQLTSAGYDRLLGSWVMEPSGPMVTNASGIHATQIGEYVLGMMLAWRLRLPLAFQLQQRAEWPRPAWPHFRHAELRGATVGIVGYGAIGREVARLATAFGMRILALKRDPQKRAASSFTFPGQGDPEGLLPEAWYGPDELVTMVSLCDYVVLAAPLTESTRGMFNAEAIHALKEGAFLVNVGRGGLVDEPVLIEALQAGRIGAALDVVSQEPLPPEHPLWQIDPQRLIITPHISGTSPLYTEKLSRLFAINLQRWLSGEELFNRIK